MSWLIGIHFGGGRSVIRRWLSWLASRWEGEGSSTRNTELWLPEVTGRASLSSISVTFAGIGVSSWSPLPPMLWQFGQNPLLDIFEEKNSRVGWKWQIFFQDLQNSSGGVIVSGGRGLQRCSHVTNLHGLAGPRSGDDVKFRGDGSLCLYSD